MVEIVDIDLEKAIRKETGVFDRPLLESDLNQVRKLDIVICSTDSVAAESILLVGRCLNLEELRINVIADSIDLSPLVHLTKLKKLDLGLLCDVNIDFIRDMKLQDLKIYGPDLSSSRLLNFEIIGEQAELKELYFCCIEPIDISLLVGCQQLESLSIVDVSGYKNALVGLDLVSEFKHLHYFELFDVALEDVDFIEKLDPGVELLISSSEINDASGLTAVSKLHVAEISDNLVNDLQYVNSIITREGITVTDNWTY